jgi:hypothetical protein
METREDQIRKEDQRLRAFQRRADAISRLILNTELPWVDIAIEIEKLRAEALRIAPWKKDLFERLYVSRFERLWQQWRRPPSPDNDEPHGSDPVPPWREH